MTQFSLSWEAYKQNICSGLSELQQNGEFVDMTIAADGHHVKVHQIVMCLVSPYIKELISSAQCPHPIIFLNKITYSTLCAILEYIYTGEVMVAKENLPELVEAAKELRIKGLGEMKLETSTQSVSPDMLVKQNEGQPFSETGIFENTLQEELTYEDETQGAVVTRSSNGKQNTEETDAEARCDSGDQECDAMATDHDDDNVNDHDDATKLKIRTISNATRIHYTVSNQGSLQILLNRFVYYLRYTSRVSGLRRWVCIEIRSNKCPASVTTNDDVVIQRKHKHNHPFHDSQIMKKIRKNAIFRTLYAAQCVGDRKRKTST